MAPKAKKKVKKPLLKGKPSSNTSLSKGAGSASKDGSDHTTKPLTKGSKLKAKNLAKLGKLSMQEKMEKVAETAESAVEGAKSLKEMMTPQESSKAWSKFQTWLKHNPEEKDSFDSLAKREKGHSVAMWLLQENVAKFMNMKESLQQSKSLDKREKWESEKTILQRFDDHELQAHIQSGRIKWRSDPWTPGYYEYFDQGDITVHVKAKASKEWSHGQEFQSNQEVESQWGQGFSRDLQSHIVDVESWGSKGKSLAKGSGKGKGKGKVPKPLALKDGIPENPNPPSPEEKTEPEQWQECISKAKKARDQANSVLSDMESALHKAEGKKRVTKTTKAEYQASMVSLGKRIAKLKQVLLKKEAAMGISALKQMLLDTASDIKLAKAEVKEMIQLANKAASRASKS